MSPFLSGTVRQMYPVTSPVELPRNKKKHGFQNHCLKYGFFGNENIVIVPSVYSKLNSHVQNKKITL